MAAAAPKESVLPATPDSDAKAHFERVGALKAVDELLQHSAYTKSPHFAATMQIVANEQMLIKNGLQLAEKVTELSASKEWRELQSLYENGHGKRISDLFRGEEGDKRVEAFTVKVPLGEKTESGADNFLYLDYSKTTIADDVKAKLLELAAAQKVPEAIKAMFAGDAINQTESRSVLHTALRRHRDGEVKDAKGEDVMPKVKEVRAQIQKFVASVHNGDWKGQSGKTVAHVVNIGIGGSDLGPVMATEALKPYAKAGITPHFVSNVDGNQLAETLKLVDLERTLFVVASKTFTTAETIQNATSAKQALLAYLEGKKIPTDGAVAKHFVAVSTAEKEVTTFGIDKANMFAFWDWVGGRYSMWSAIGLSIALAVGYNNFEEMLKGAEAMDQHFETARLEENLPALMALVGVWHNNFCGYSTLAVLPYLQYLHRLPAYLQQLDMESNGKAAAKAGDATAVDVQTGPIVFGEPGTNGQHAFYQLLHQGTKIVPCDFIGALEAHNPIADGKHHVMLLANMFAQAESLMLGKNRHQVRNDISEEKKYSRAEQQYLVSHKTFGGNRPSQTLIVRKLTPRAFGALVAAYEHKVYVQGVIWGINSFDQWGVELGKTLARRVLPELSLDALPAEGQDGSTAGLIAHVKAIRVAIDPPAVLAQLGSPQP